MGAVESVCSRDSSRIASERGGVPFVHRGSGRVTVNVVDSIPGPRIISVWRKSSRYRNHNGACGGVKSISGAVISILPARV